MVGVVVHNADILPALISNPASASSRRISVDFQMPLFAATSRRFHFTGSSPHRKAVRDPLVGQRPGVLDVLGVHVNVPRRRGQPLVAE